MFKGKLYHFQELGVKQMLASNGFLLADEMGLGKTIQTINVCEQAKTIKNLIVCPNSVTTQWKQEIEKFSNSSVKVINGTKKQREKQWSEQTKYTIINYEKVLSDFEFINNSIWGSLILDEAQRIKNWKSKTSQLIKKIYANRKYALTGTPIVNKPEELYNIFSFLKPWFLGSWLEFQNNYMILREVNLPDGRHWIETVGYQNLDLLRNKIKQRFLRRQKREVFKDMPPVTMQNINVELNKEQQYWYDIVEEEIFNAIENKESFIHLGMFLLIICTSLKAFSLGEHKFAVTPTQISPKIIELITLLNDIFSQPNTKIVVFTKWRRVLDDIQNNIEFEHSVIKGGQSTEERQQELKKFTEGNNNLLLSTDAGGVGLNLQCASYIINIDLPWTMAALNQRIGRIDRIGQKKNVTVINLLTKNTREERVLEILAKKQSYHDAIIESNEFKIKNQSNLINELFKGARK